MPFWPFFKAKSTKNDQNFPKNCDFFIIPPKNGHKMGTRPSFLMKSSGKCSSEPKENTFEQVFCLKNGGGPPNFGFLRPRVAIFSQILTIFDQNRPKSGPFLVIFLVKNPKFRKNPAKKVYAPYRRLKKGCFAVILVVFSAYFDTWIKSWAKGF